MKQLFTYFSGFALKLVLVCSMLTGLNAAAQTYPVQTSIATTGPYLNYLSYYGDHNNHLQITVTNLNFSLPPVLVRLRLRIEGSGWELYTDPNATIGQPFLLEPGMPLTISGIELLPYLQQNNLINPNGIDLNDLPHGFTNICVDVIRESAQQQVLSTNNCGFLPIQEYQPPQAFTPLCGEQLDTAMMFHNFTWSPPVPFPAGADLELFYDFSIHHWVDPNNNAALGGNSILVYEQTDLIAPTTQVSDFDVQFEQGGTYVWKVTARVESNGIPVSLIENGGVSAPCTFVYGQALSVTDQLADGLEIELFTEPSSERKGKAWWTVTDNTPNQGLSNFDAFFVEYRKQPTGNEGFEIPWHSKTLTSFEHFIYQLEPSTTYEVKVSGVIAGTVGNPTPVKTFTTPDPRIYNCGEADLPYLPSNYTPLENATVGTQVQIGQFMMTLTELYELGGGHYTGKGIIPVAFLGGAKAKVRFDDILIDTEYRVHQGRVDVITQGLESWLDDQYQQFIDPYYVDGVVDSAWVDTAAGVAWVVVDGVNHEFTFDPPHYPIIVNDENGNQYTIYPNGTIVVNSYLAISETWAATADEVIHFSQNDSELRGFDPKEHMEWHENYEVMELADSSKYFVANKSLAKGEADKVNVEIPAGANASFQFSDGTPVPSSSLQGNWIGETTHTGSTKMTLSIPAKNSSGNYSIYALVNNQKVGQLNVQVYSKKERELVIVPISVTSLTEAQIKSELDQTLGEANIDVSVTLAPQWNNANFTPTTSISLPDDVGLLSSYSEQQRNLRDAYFAANPNAPKNKYYLFLVSEFDDPDELGYMVRGRALGFISTNQPNVLSTISHELAHGMGALEHTWKNNGPARGTTSNLMDYDEGQNQGLKDNLIKAQWKELRDLDILPSLFDDVDDYMSQMSQFAPKVPTDTPPTAQYEYIEESLVSVDDALMVNGGWYVKFKTPSRSKFTHFCLVDGKVIGLFKGNQYLALSTTSYRSVPVENQEYDVEVTGESHVIRFLTTDTILAANREYKTALHGSDTTKLIKKYVHSDIRGITYIDVVTCDEIDGVYINGKSNGALTRDTVQCPEGGDCNQNDILDIVKNDKDAIKNEFLSIIQSANGGFNWNPVRFIEGQNDIITTKDVTVITEKIQTLNHYRNNTVVGVVSLKGLLNNLYTVEMLDQMASDVVDELAVDYPNKKLVLFLAHYIKQEENGIFTTTPYTCQRVAFATNDADLIDDGFTQLDLLNASNATNAFLSLFTRIKKPHHIVNIYEKFDGSITIYESENLNDPTTDQSGLPYIKGAFHLVSKYKSEYFEAVDELRSSVVNFTPPTGYTGYATIDTFLSNQRQLYANLKGNLDANITYWDSEKLDMPQFWISGNIDFSNIREHYVSADVIRSEFFIKKNGIQYFADLAMAHGWEVGASNSSIYYEFDIMSNVIDPIIYGAVDILGVVPGIDYLADGAGLLYSTIRGNGENVVIYSAALAVPFVGAGVIKTGEKIYAVFAKEVNEQLVDISVKQMDEATEGWTRISSEVATDNTQEQSVKQAMEGAVDQFDELAAKKIIILEEGIQNLSGKASIISKLDGLGNLEHTKNFVNSLDETQDATLINLLSKIDDSKLVNLNSFYSKLSSNTPSPFGATDFNFTATKNIQIEGKKVINGIETTVTRNVQVSMEFRHGFPRFHKTVYCPEILFPNGELKKYKYFNENLNFDNYSSHFKDANESLLNAFGIQKGSPKNAQGFYQSGNYRWNGVSPQFELRNSDGAWEKYTWHHFEDGKTMIPVLSNVHTAAMGGFTHAGGKSLVKHGVLEIFSFEDF